MINFLKGFFKDRREGIYHVKGVAPFEEQYMGFTVVKEVRNMGKLVLVSHSQIQDAPYPHLASLINLPRYICADEIEWLDQKEK